VRIYHVDLYRLETSEEARRVGLEELFERPALTLIEWGERFPELMPAERTEIRIEHAGEDRRAIMLSLRAASRPLS
jgi:tRNA threonylcarbamoyladenosine biosynthesis protein TsaE